MSYSEAITYEDLKRILEGIPMAVFTYGRGEVGEVRPFAGSDVPTGWLLCNGQAVSRTDYAELFSVIGTTYGSGDGSTTFNVPDMRNRFLVGAGDEYSLNSKGGEKTHTLTINEMPKHDHDLQFQGYGNYNFNLVFQYGTYNNTGKYPPNGGYLGYRGGDQPHENRPPYIGINFIIYAKNTTNVASPQIDLFYPVGSYYETSDASFDPNVSWGGTWTHGTQTIETEEELYSGSFSSGTITLSDSVSNYNEIMVVYADNDAPTKTHVVRHNKANAFQTYFDATRITSGWYAKSMLAYFSGNQVTKGYNRQAYFSAVGAEGSYIIVKQIIGKKIETSHRWHRTA